MGFAEHRRGRDRPLLDRRHDRPLPCLLQLCQLQRRRLGQWRFRTRLGARLGDWRRWDMSLLLECLEPADRDALSGLISRLLVAYAADHGIDLFATVDTDISPAGG